MLRDFLCDVGPRLSDASLSNYVCDCPQQEATVNALIDYAYEMEQQVIRGNGIILFGPSGTGKDHLLIGLARLAILHHSYSLKYVFGVDLFSELRDRIDNDASEEQWVLRLVRPAILILSDPIPPRGDTTTFQASMLQRVINKRYNARRPTWVTLNVSSSAEADDRLGAAIVDRLKDGALALYCDWPSHRRTKALDSADNATADSERILEP